MLPTVTETLPGGKRLRVARLGSGPPLVLLHGYPENLQLFCELAPRLAGRFEVIAFDWPGMGWSDGWPGGTTPLHMAERIRKLQQIWDLPPLTLVGNDMGGQPALAFAARFPAETARVVVMNSLLFGEEETSWEIRVLRKFGWNRLILRRFPRAVFRRAERTFLPPGTSLPSDLRVDFWEAFRRPEVRTFVVRLCAGYQGRLASLPQLYAEIRAPALALWGERDRHFPPVHARKLQATLPGARVEILPAAEHWMAWDRAEEVAGRILDFAAATE
jgi:pimeloyl-ACP methyl ester carboxylesterase